MATILARAKTARHFPNWIDAFCEYTSALPAGLEFRRWVGIVTIAGALERKVWISPFGTPLYPNLFVVLVAGPGIGKTVLSSTVARLWRELSDHHVAPSSVSRATLVDSLADAKRKIVRPGEDPPYFEFNCLNVSANELGVLIPQWDMDFMNHLTDLYDGHPYQERKRTGSINIKIDHPTLNLFGCTTPNWLTNTMPAEAWEQGFTSRTLFIYSGDRIVRDLIGLVPGAPMASGPHPLHAKLIADLKRISELFGLVHCDEDAAGAIRAWHMAGGPPIPSHPKLTHYLTRRTAHLLKLCMILTAAKSDILRITLETYQEALNLLIAMEDSLPEVFRAIAVGGDAAAMHELQYAMQREYAKTNTPVPEAMLVNFLRDRVPSHSVMRIIELMVRGRSLKQSVTAAGGTGYIPTGRPSFD